MLEAPGLGLPQQPREEFREEATLALGNPPRSQSSDPVTLSDRNATR